MQKLVFYTRVSTKEQGDSRNGLEAQYDALEGFAHREGHEVLAHYEEVVSGKHDLDRRPVLRAALDHAKRTGATLIVSKLDRLSRSVQFISTMMTSGVRFGTAEDGLKYEPMHLHLKAVFAEEERRRISQRTKEGLARVKARGTKLGGVRPNHAIGLAKTAAFHKAESDTFARHMAPAILRLRREAMSVNSIAQELNRQGTHTQRGGKWHATTVCNILDRLVQMGDIPSWK